MEHSILYDEKFDVLRIREVGKGNSDYYGETQENGYITEFRDMTTEELRGFEIMDFKKRFMNNKTYNHNLKEFLDRYDHIFAKEDNGELLSKEDEDFLWNYELYFAKAILDRYSSYPSGLNNPAVKVAKIILAATGTDNHITISTEIK